MAHEPQMSTNKNHNSDDISDIGTRQPLSWVERLILPLRLASPGMPPRQTWGFIWHHVRQHKGPFATLILLKIFEVAADLALPVSLGLITDIIALPGDRAEIFQERLPIFIALGLFFALGRPLIYIVKMAIADLGIMPGFAVMVRWQNHHHMVGQDMKFFSDDFAGRLAQRIMQTGFSVREVALRSIEVQLYVALSLVGTALILAFTSPLLALPLVFWTAIQAFLIFHFMPRIEVSSRQHSELRSELTGKIVDSYSNIQTVKLFAARGQEDHDIADSMDRFNFGWIRVMRQNFNMTIVMTLANGLLLAATGALAIWLWLNDYATVGIIATAMPLAFNMTTHSEFLMWQLSGLFEQVGTIAEGAESISQPHGVQDIDGAPALQVTGGAVRFDQVHFNYGKQVSEDPRKQAVFEGLTLDIKAGEKIGLVGHSGAGKSSLVNLLLRFYDIDSGAILIDGQNVARVSQESLRRNIAMVTQDTSLLHRSIRQNILYGNAGASDEQMWDAIRQAQADRFIPDLEDAKGRKGLDAHVGERGVKLSGGQRQRIALARVILKDAPILVLDEATSALDSEVEAAIQDQLLDLMQGKTVIAIAHRLSTIAKLDRLVVMDHGKVIEEGSHQQLLDADGHYAKLWKLQSGGFLGGSG